MSLPKISISLDNSIHENYPKKFIKNKKIKKILNKSIGIGTNDIDEFENEKETISTNDRNSIVTSNRKSNHNKIINTQKINITDNKNQNFINSNSNKFLKPILKINSNRTITNSPRILRNNIQKPNSKDLHKSKTYFNRDNNSKENKIPYKNIIKNSNEDNQPIYKYHTIDNKTNILNNNFIKSIFYPKKKYLIKDNYLNFKNKEDEKIVSDDKTLIGSLVNQTNSNFNNKYNIQYWSKNNKKRDQIKHCFTLFKNGTNISSIDNILNGPKEVILYQIPYLNISIEGNEKKFLSYKLKCKKVTINSLEYIRPLTGNINIQKK